MSLHSGSERKTINNFRKTKNCDGNKQSVRQWEYRKLL